MDKKYRLEIARALGIGNMEKLNAILGETTPDDRVYVRYKVLSRTQWDMVRDGISGVQGVNATIDDITEFDEGNGLILSLDVAAESSVGSPKEATLQGNYLIALFKHDMGTTNTAEMLGRKVHAYIDTQTDALAFEIRRDIYGR